MSNNNLATIRMVTFKVLDEFLNQLKTVSGFNYEFEGEFGRKGAKIGDTLYPRKPQRWLVKTGETVKRGQNLMEVLTDKATMEVPSPFAGTVTALHAEPGQQIKVGDAVLAYTPAGQEESAQVREREKERVRGVQI